MQLAGGYKNANFISKLDCFVYTEWSRRAGVWGGPECDTERVDQISTWIVRN